MCWWMAGYVHGRHPEICPHKCKPQLHIGKGETKKQTLIREAVEFQASLCIIRACVVIVSGCDGRHCQPRAALQLGG